MKRSFWVCLLLAGSLSSADGGLTGDLKHVAEVASVMVDGDVCLRIQTARSKRFSTLKDARDPWRYGDNYEVDHAAFNQTKKTLIRLARLCRYPCDVNLWMPAGESFERVQIVIRNVHEMSQFWNWGDMEQPMPEEMARVLKTASSVVVQHRPGMISVLAPIFDSLNNVAGLVEVVGEMKENPRENVK